MTDEISGRSISARLQAESEKQVRLAAQLYEVRDSMRFLHGEKYGERSARAGELVKRVADLKKVEILVAAQLLAKEADENGHPYNALLFVAAAVDILDRPEAPARTTVLHA